MLVAADLHVHSRHAKAVSPAMTLEAIAGWARRKGIDLIGTGDCLHPIWLAELERNLVETEPGIFALGPEMDAQIQSKLSAGLQRPLRFVLSTEVHCAPPGTRELEGVHHLLYFRSFASLRRLQRQLSRWGNLDDGRPRLVLDSRQLLELVLALGPECQFAPAHVWNPFFSAFGSQGGSASLAELFGELASHVTLVETGLTSIPSMCRRVSSLDGCALFSCSDAHSLENLGRECTLVESELTYDDLFAALQGKGPGRVLGTIKFPLERTRYYRNRCLSCQKSFEGSRCPKCRGVLVSGSHDRLEHIADRPEPIMPANSPLCRMVLPLRDVVAELFGCGRESKGVERFYFRLLEEIGSERFILTEASPEIITQVGTPQLTQAIVSQRQEAPGARREVKSGPAPDQLALFSEF